jgi:two-component system cell cycle response regulator DivK
MLVEYLSFSGFDVSQARDGVEAVGVARRVRPAIILLDLEMPGLTGWGTARQLKADPLTRTCIVIAVSGHDAATAEESARAAGCDGFLMKPLDLQALSETLHSMLTTAGREIESE